MRVLVAGSCGQLGADVTARLTAAHEVTGADLPGFDITRPGQVADLVADCRPEVIVNCAAFTRVDDCEMREAEARRVNADGPAFLARAARDRGAVLVHVSTDYVFDGTREPPAPYRECDPPCPVSAYGRTKLAGERAVAEAAPRHVILRTAWLYGRHGPNFLKAILRKALRSGGEPFRVVNDQFGSPTWSLRLARQIERLVGSDAQGLYHAAGEGFTTWYALACRFLETLGVPHRIEPCGTDAYPTPARRPRNSILENARLREEGRCVMAGWAEDLETFARQHGESIRDEALARPPAT